MPFDKVETQQMDFPARERAVLEFWRRTGAFEKVVAKNRGGPRWSFLDGPITANNPMGVHHAWGRTYKDAFQRYHAMLGCEQRYQNGFDCQGLWVEVEVEKELRLGSKRDIENLVPGDPFASIDRFVQLCKQRVDKFARVQTEQSIRLGYWMDWDRTDEDWARRPDERKSYFTMSEENNYTIWSFLKKCHDRGLIYRGYDAMPWCPRCGVGLSEMEVKEGYKQVHHKSVFVKFPLRDRPGENLLVWTTTPWTLTSNVGAAVNPEQTYLKVRHNGEVYYVGKTAFNASRGDEEAPRDEVEVDVDRTEDTEALHRLKSIEQLFKEKGREGFDVVGEVSGADMVGWAYDGPFDELPAQHAPNGYPELTAFFFSRLQLERMPEGFSGTVQAMSAKDAHRVVAWKEVGATTGTGIVHIAPGCGEEDFHLGKEVGLPPVAPLDDAGVFLPGFGCLTGASAVDPATADRILDDLKAKGRVFAWESYGHSYPHCWRCKTELLFRLVDEWFINMKWRGEIMDVTRQATFLPPAIQGEKRELKWLEQMHDWMISKKRFWGLALPIWVDEKTGDFEVIGSREELKERAVEGWEEFEGHTPHRPWIDKVKIRNLRTGNRMIRIPDVGNPWLDAGIVPFSTVGYNRDREYWGRWFPADFITESFPGQFRNWFYAILAMSTMMEHRPPFRALLGHALVRDQHGETMAKTKGNAIEFNGAANDGYDLFHDRDPKLSVEQQARRDLPRGWTSCSEGEVVIEGKPKEVVKGRYPPIGADVIRWLYCRSNPAANINFGPETADEVRSRFVLKLWNTYAFFCNYARLDGFDPNAAPVPVAGRPDLDRWILSDLQKLVQKARESFEGYDVMNFCLETERFVDDKLSNWYVRRNRRRFWKAERGPDKQAAYQTLYAVLVTLTKLCGPIIPFLSEQMYQNLVVHGAGLGPESVHLCDFPATDPALIDEGLSADMNALLEVVSLGSAARNSVKIKVRQPLAELKVQPAGESQRRAVERFPDQIIEELNVKKVTPHDPEAGPLLHYEVRPNMKALGPKLGPRLNEVRASLLAAGPDWVAAEVRRGGPVELACPGGPVTIEPGDVALVPRAPEGWAGVAEGEMQVLLDVRITDDLAREGMARDIVRMVQDLRKKADLAIEDRITLRLHTDAEPLRQAIDAHRKYIADETLTLHWATEPLNGDASSMSAKVEKYELLIELRRVSPG
jgi:isoleucyl-tRNA synthetase